MEKKKKIRFNIIDAIIILAVLLVCAFFVIKFTGFGREVAALNPEEKTCRITFFQAESENYVVESSKVGDHAYDASAGINMGTVVDIKSEPLAETIIEDGQEYAVDSKTKSSVYITVELQGSPGEFGVTVGDTLYSIGHSLSLRAGMCKYYPSVYSIEVLD